MTQVQLDFDQRRRASGRLDYMRASGPTLLQFPQFLFLFAFLSPSYLALLPPPSTMASPLKFSSDFEHSSSSDAIPFSHTSVPRNTGFPSGSGTGLSAHPNTQSFNGPAFPLGGSLPHTQPAPVYSSSVCPHPTFCSHQCDLFYLQYPPPVYQTIPHAPGNPYTQGHCSMCPAVCAERDMWRKLYLDVK